MNVQKIKKEISELTDQCGRDRSAMLPILRELQKRYHGISAEMMYEIAEQLNVNPIDVQSVISFYHFLNVKPKGEIIVRVCNCPSCKMAGADDVAHQLEKDLRIKLGETSADGKYTLEWTSCIGMCDQVPAMLVNDRPYVNVVPEKAYQLIKEYSKTTDTNINAKNTNNFSFAEIKNGIGLKAAIAKGSAGIIDEVIASKLKGCGGAGFPTGLKLKFAAAAPGDEKYVICNADEGEPGTFKDRELLSRYADLVFEGMAIAGIAIGAKNGILYLRGEYEYLKPQLENVLQKRRAANFLGKGVGFDIEIKMGAGAYVCGEETALIESLEGCRGLPRNKPPFPVVVGYKNKPTSPNNVETFIWIASIMAKSAKWFNAVGTEKSAGFKIFSISGDCERPGVYEFPMGTTIAQVLKTVGGEKAKAVQCGGASGQTIPASKFNRKLAFEDAPPGGSIIIIGPKRNILDVLENFMDFFVEESCGQCTPCREGNAKILEGVKMMKEGKCSAEYLAKLKSLCETMKLASKCGFGQSSCNAFLSIVEHFQNEIPGHADR